MKKSIGLFLIVAAFLTAVPAAFAKDEDRWTGPYVGLTLGHVQGDAQEVPDQKRPQAKLNGELYGVVIGYNHRVGESNLVLGVESDFQRASIEGSRTEDLCPGCVVSNINETKIEMDWLNTIRARIGYLANDEKILIYVDAGPGYGRAKTSILNTRRFGGLINTSHSWAEQGVFGYTFGAGIDCAITKNVTLGAGWRHITFDILKVASNFSTGNTTISEDAFSVALKLGF